MFSAVKRMRRLLYGAAFFTFTLHGQTADQVAQSQRAKELMAQGRFANAIPIYRTLVQQLPGNTGLLLNLAMAETMGGQPKDAIPHCRALLQRDAQSVPALSMLAMASLQVNQPAEAVIPLRKLVALTPDNLDARGMLAGAEMSLNHFASAAAQYVKLTSVASNDAKGWYGLGKAYEGLAAERFEKLLKTAPQSAYVAVLLGDSRKQQRQYRSAFFFFRQAEKQMPNLSGVHSGLAGVYQSTGHANWAEMEKNREAALLSSCGPSSSSEVCLFHRGKLSVLAQRSAETPPSLFWSVRASNQLALDAFERLGKLPESTELHALKAQVLHSHKQDIEAAREWEAALAISNEAERPHIEGELAIAWFLGRDYAKAIPALEKMLAADPSSPDLNFMLGESLWRTQQGDRAAVYLEKSIHARPEFLPAYADLGLLLLSLNQPAKAVAHLEKAQSLDEDGSLHYSLARAYQASGDAEGARKSMAAYQEIQKRNNEANSELGIEAEITAPS